MQEEILESIEEAVCAMQFLQREESVNFIRDVTDEICACFEREGKVLIAGNGGSMCDAAHFAEEMTGFFRDRRRALPVLALADPGHMSCVGNDIGFEHIFGRHVEAFGKPEDVLILLSTSGNSPNLLNAYDVAKTIGMKTMGFLGKDGGKLKGKCDYEWIVSPFSYSDRIQEAHMCALHIVVEMVEKKLLCCHAY